ncbi:MAG: hypothetical protein LBH29_03365 [Elusimicrobiota bacterium]|jgi:hypothetical protein|nr:hypothetical protein [Elusimicrobiota bacterium]
MTKNIGKIIDAKSEGLESKDINFYLSEISAAGNREKEWRLAAESYFRKYASERDSALGADERLRRKGGRFNVFYSNTEILKSALLPDIPHLIIERRFAKEQAQDDKEKQFYAAVSEIVERAVSYNTNDGAAADEIEAFKYDYLIAGRGVLWCVLSNKTQEGEEADGKSIEIVEQRVKIEHINYDDFRFSSGRKWSEVWWIARRHLLKRQDLIERFGAKKGEAVKIEARVEGKKDKGDNYIKENLAQVWEIWDRDERRIYFVCEGYPDDFLEIKEDPYKLDNFYPTVEPLRSIRSNLNLKAVPEYEIYKAEAEDLSECAARAAKLIKSIQAKAFYPARYKDLIKNLETSEDNEYVGIDVTGEINDAGGITSIFAYPPIEAKQRVAAGLYEHQNHLLNVIYNITGISDIMRNASTDETATATRQKGRFGALRLQERQKAIDNYIKGIYSIITEIVCESFTIGSLREISSISLPTEEQKGQYQGRIELLASKQQEFQEQIKQAQERAQALIVSGRKEEGQRLIAEIERRSQAAQGQLQKMQPNAETAKFMSLPTWESVKEFLENNRLRSYLLDIETAFSIWADDEQTRKERIELLNIWTESIQKAMPIIAQAPELAQTFNKLISWAIDGFRASRSVKNGIEDALSQMVEKIKQQAAQPKQQQVDPQLLLAQAEQTRAQGEVMSAQAKVQEVQQEAKIKEEEIKIKVRELAIKEAELGIKEREFGINSQAKAADIKIKEDKNVIEALKAGS